MRYTDDDSLTGLGTAKRGSLPRGGRQWTGTLRQRAHASRGLPPVVFKISSYSHSVGAVWARVQYVSREGELEAEGPNGELLDQGQLAGMVADWDRETVEGQGRRFAMTAVVSFPQGVDEEKATEAGRQFFREAFADNHDYVFAGHTDSQNFHLHVVVQAAGHDGKQIRLNRAAIQDLRLLLAEKAHAQGIELDASPRWARGLAAQRQKGLGVEGIERRGETPVLGPGEPWTPEKELRGARRLSPDRRTQLEALVEVRRERDPAAAPGVTPLEYVRAAELLAGQIGQGEHTREQVQTMKAAAELAGRGVQLASSLRSSPNHDDREAAQARADFLVSEVERVDMSINSQIRGLGSGAEQHAAITARRGFAEKISQYHQGAREAVGQESAEPGRARGAEERRESAQARDACQALEYARDAAGIAGHIHTLTTDKERVGAVKAAVSLARFGWDLAHQDQGPAEDREEARHIIDRAEVALRFAIKRIEDPQVQREAIQSRQTLYTSDLKEYRAERRAREWAERTAAEERDTGPELEP